MKTIGRPAGSGVGSGWRPGGVFGRHPTLPPDPAEGTRRPHIMSAGGVAPKAPQPHDSNSARMTGNCGFASLRVPSRPLASLRVLSRVLNNESGGRFDPEKRTVGQVCNLPFLRGPANTHPENPTKERRFSQRGKGAKSAKGGVARWLVTFPMDDESYFPAFSAPGIPCTLHSLPPAFRGLSPHHHPSHAFWRGPLRRPPLLAPWGANP